MATLVGNLLRGITDAAKASVSTVVGSQGDKAKAAIKLLQGDVKGSASTLVSSLKDQAKGLVADAKSKTVDVIRGGDVKKVETPSFGDIYNSIMADTRAQAAISDLKKSGIKSIRQVARTVEGALKDEQINDVSNVIAAEKGTTYGDVLVTPTDDISSLKGNTGSIYSDVSGSASSQNDLKAKTYTSLDFVTKYWYVVVAVIVLIYFSLIRRR
jgi:hypothetical protein